MSHHRPFLSWSLALVSAIAFVVGASAQQVARAVSQAVVTPENPIFLQDPPPPQQEPPAQQTGRGGRGGGAQQPPQPRPYNEVITAEARRDDGIFTVFRVGESLYFEIPRAELGKDFLWVTQIKRTTFGAGYGGQAVGNRVVRWELVGPRVYLKSVDYGIVASDQANPIQRAVADAANPTIVRAFNVAAFSPQQNPVIDVTSMYLSDLAEFSGRSAVGGRGMDAQRSYLDKVVSFPQNINVEVMQTFTIGGDPGAAGAGAPAPAAGRRGARGPSGTILLFHGMIKLPETPMMGRLFDERVGYFSQSMIDFSRPEHRSETRTFITKYRLEKRDPSAAISEPVKPITYYVDPATPTKWVPYVKMGIESWKPAFEAAGFRNGIVAAEAPKDDPDWSGEDVRYSVIRWLPSTTENAVGPHVHDPRSGEILEADVQFYHNVQNLAKNWFFVQSGPLDPRAKTLPLPDDLMGKLIAYVVAHEVGHTLGFQHNMKASSTYTLQQVRDKEFLRRNGHTPTLMDYSRFNYVAQPEDGVAPDDLIPKIGEYDKWATHWGYAPIPGARTPDDEKPTLDRWAREQDANPQYRFSTAGGVGDPGNNTEAVGDGDAVQATTLGLKNLQRVADMLLTATTTQTGDPYDELAEVYGRMAGQWTTEMNHVTQLVGGVLSQQKHIGQMGARFTTVPRAKQAEAVQFLLANAFQTPQFMIKPELLRRMEPTGIVNRVRTAQNSVLNSLLQTARIERLIEQAAVDGAAAYTPIEFLGNVRAGIWSELRTPGRAIDTYRRNTQRAYLDTIDNRLNGGAEPTGEVRALLKGELRALRGQIVAAIPGATDRATRLHLEDSRDAIDEILDPRAMRVRADAAAAAGRGGRGGAAGSVRALDSTARFDYENDPFLARPTTCWPDYVIR
jgi:hypothetical protein